MEDILYNHTKQPRPVKLVVKKCDELHRPPASSSISNSDDSSTPGEKLKLSHEKGALLAGVALSVYPFSQ